MKPDLYDPRLRLTWMDFDPDSLRLKEGKVIGLKEVAAMRVARFVKEDVDWFSPIHISAMQVELPAGELKLNVIGSYRLNWDQAVVLYERIKDVHTDA